MTPASAVALQRLTFVQKMLVSATQLAIFILSIFYVQHGTLTPGNTGCDPTGFPTGRRPGDDVVDIVLDVAIGYLLPNAPAYPSDGGTDVFLTDGVQWPAPNFQSTFPYLNPPTGGANGDGTFPSSIVK